LQSPDDFCKLDYKNEELSNLTIKPDPSNTIGLKAVENFFQKLYTYKSTIDLDAGVKI